MYNNVWQCIIIYGNVRQSAYTYNTIWYNLGQSSTVTNCTVTARKEGKRSAYMDVQTAWL